MFKKGRTYRWILGLSGAAVLLQAGSCAANPTISQQILLPQLASIVSDFIFFLLDNALVRATT